MFRRFIATGVLLAATIGLVACGTSSPAPTKPSAADEPAARTTYPLTIQTFDFARNKVDVTIPKAPEKVLVDGVNNVEIMLKLGLEDRIEMLAEADKTIKSVFPDLVPAYGKIKKVGDTFPSKEEVIAMQPDFILGWYGAFQDKMLGGVGFWHERGIGTYMSLNSSAQGPDVPQEIKYEYDDIMNIGKIFDVQEKAKKIVDDMKKSVDESKAKLSKGNSPKIAILEAGDGSYRVYRQDHLAGSIAEAAGAEIVIGNKADNFTRKINKEQLIQANPDNIFLVHFRGVDDKVPAVEEMLNDPAFASLNAVKNKHVYGIPLSYIYTSGLRTQLGIELFAKRLGK